MQGAEGRRGTTKLALSHPLLSYLSAPSLLKLNFCLNVSITLTMVGPGSGGPLAVSENDAVDRRNERKPVLILLKPLMLVWI